MSEVVECNWSIRSSTCLDDKKTGEACGSNPAMSHGSNWMGRCSENGVYLGEGATRAYVSPGRTLCNG